MRRSLLLLSVLSLLLVLGACASEPAKTTEPAATDTAAAPDASADPLTGTWKGDWGPTAEPVSYTHLTLPTILRV